MLRSKKVNIIFSLIIAISLWGYVVSETNPIVSKTFKAVPITYINERVLSSAGLAISNKSVDEVDLTVKGNRKKINSLSIEDFTVTCDLSNATEGANDIKLNIQVPNYTELESSSTTRITANIEPEASKDVAVSIQYNGNYEVDKEPLTVSKSISHVTISGGLSQVESVDHIKAVIDVSDVTSQVKTFDTELEAVDRNGLKVENVKLSDKTVQVKAQTAKLKTVPLIVPVKNLNGEEEGRTYTAPNQIKIKGTTDDIKKVTSIKTKEINITDVKKNKKIKLELLLPNRITLAKANEEELLLDVIVEEQQHISFDFSTKEIDFDGTDEDVDYKIEDGTIEVTAYGTSKAIANLKKEDIKLESSLKNLEKGEHSLDIEVICNKTHKKIIASPDKIKVTIE